MHVHGGRRRLRVPAGGGPAPAADDSDGTDRVCVGCRGIRAMLDCGAPDSVAPNGIRLSRGASIYGRALLH
ncbi:hypothetical protein GCM10010124_09460 [Pilimelia terevasa]|uniref:Uncharacterized protein n=1 Tax=Pilimelia terevasa TaxID=53372 RepID=A0A8J3BH10_9ACTN|nr:hypothetical protein GCM10010124_09460 [Pilimelia terevasa]